MQTDATLDEGTEPDLKVIDSDMNLMPPDLNAGSLLEFFNQLTSKSSSSLESFPIKEEPLSEEDLKVLQKDRQKKDNHNLSKRHRTSMGPYWSCAKILVFSSSKAAKNSKNLIDR